MQFANELLSWALETVLYGESHWVRIFIEQFQRMNFWSEEIFEIVKTWDVSAFEG